MAIWHRSGSFLAHNDVCIEDGSVYAVGKRMRLFPRYTLCAPFVRAQVMRFIVSTCNVAVKHRHSRCAAPNHSSERWLV